MPLRQLNCQFNIYSMLLQRKMFSICSFLLMLSETGLILESLPFESWLLLNRLLIKKTKCNAESEFKNKTESQFRNKTQSHLSVYNSYKKHAFLIIIQIMLNSKHF